MEDPGSFSGKINSPNPDLGPEAKNRISLQILNIETESVFNTADKLTSASWAAIDSNLLCDGKYFSSSVYRMLDGKDDERFTCGIN